MSDLLTDIEYLEQQYLDAGQSKSHEMRTVLEAARLVADPNLADTFANAVTIDGGHHKQWYLEHLADYFGIELPDHEPGIAP